MSDFTCLWCGEDMEEAVMGDAPIEYVCQAADCVAKGVCIPKEMTIVPCEVEVWQVIYGFPESNVGPDEKVADWLGLFATEKLALKAAKEEFDGLYDMDEFFVDAVPVVLKINGGV